MYGFFQFRINTGKLNRTARFGLKGEYYGTGSYRYCKEIERLKGLRCRILAGPEPGEAFENEDICFVYGGQGLNLEIIDTLKRAGRL